VIDIVVRTSEVERTELIALLGSYPSRTSRRSKSWQSISINTSPRSCTHWSEIAATVIPAESKTLPTPSCSSMEASSQHGIWVRAVGEVFIARGSARALVEPPDPAADWLAHYAELPSDRQLSAPDIAAAMSALRTFWAQATDPEPEGLTDKTACHRQTYAGDERRFWKGL
jgi:hypothetical protein